MGNRRHIPDGAKLVALGLPGTDSDRRALTGISQRALRRARKALMETGAPSRPAYDIGRPRALTGVDLAFLEALLEHTPDMYLEEMRDQLIERRGIEVTPQCIAKSLHRRGLTLKTLSRPAIERDEVDRALYCMLFAEQYEAYQLVFVDESGCNRNVARRRRGWAPEGDRARLRDFFIRGVKYSMLPALSLDGILCLDVHQGSINGERFWDFIEGLLEHMQPFPGPNSVIVMDNASIHKSQELVEMVEARGMRMLFLPAYSPDLNPIEEAFSSIKAWIRRNRDWVLAELSGDVDCDPFGILWDAVYSVTAEMASGWFRHSGYI